MSGTWPHLYRLRVRSYDLDALGHANNGAYVRWLEEARVAFLEERGWSFSGARQEGALPVVARLEVDFRAEVGYPEELLIATRIGGLGRSSLRLEHEIRRASDGVLAAQAVVVLVWVDVASRRPRPLPDALRHLLQELA
jgi:acyl-CoA thioester hydrolase